MSLFTTSIYGPEGGKKIRGEEDASTCFNYCLGFGHCSSGPLARVIKPLSRLNLSQPIRIKEIPEMASQSLNDMRLIP